MNLYNKAFYMRQVGGSGRSAARIVPILVSIIQPESVVDVGCGTGVWLSNLMAAGVGDVLGVDGSHVERCRLRIPIDRFLAHDLTQPLAVGRTFDLALCLEVAEHLPATRARGLVADLTALAPVIAFSAAVPGQGGTGHVNEQWPTWWQELFEQSGYDCLDCIRARIWNDSSVEWWYRQNILLFVRRAELARYSFSSCPPPPLSIVHPAMIESKSGPKIRPLIGALLDRTLRRWIKRG